MGGKLSPSDPMDSPGKRAGAAEVRLTPAFVLTWLSLHLRLVPRISKVELRRWSPNCLLRSPVSLLCELPSSPANAAEMSDIDDSSFLMPVASSPVDEV